MSTDYEFSLVVADGWSEIDPIETDYTLLYEDKQLIMTSTDFRNRRELGFIGGLNCPIAVDDADKIAYRAATDEESYFQERFTRSGCHIAAFDLESGEQRVAAQVPEGFACYWLLTLLPDRRHLLALLNSHTDPKARRFASIEIGSGAILETLAEEKLFSPQAIDPKRGRMVFSSGKNNAFLLDFEGKTISETSRLTGWIRGATFLPESESIVVGHGGVQIWDPNSGEVKTVLPSGYEPVADEQGNIWFDSSGGSIARYNPHTGEAEEIFRLSGIDIDGTNFLQPVVFTADFRLGLARLTGRIELTGEELAEREKFYRDAGCRFPKTGKYNHKHCFCVFDREQKTIWKHPGYAHNVAWVSGRFGE